MFVRESIHRSHSQKWGTSWYLYPFHIYSCRPTCPSYPRIFLLSLFIHPTVRSFCLMTFTFLTRWKNCLFHAGPLGKAVWLSTSSWLVLPWHHAFSIIKELWSCPSAWLSLAFNPSYVKWGISTLMIVLKILDHVILHIWVFCLHVWTWLIREPSATDARGHQLFSLNWVYGWLWFACVLQEWNLALYNNSKCSYHWSISPPPGLLWLQLLTACDILCTLTEG